MQARLPILFLRAPQSEHDVVASKLIPCSRGWNSKYSGRDDLDHPVSHDQLSTRSRTIFCEGEGEAQPTRPSAWVTRIGAFRGSFPSSAKTRVQTQSNPRRSWGKKKTRSTAVAPGQASHTRCIEVRVLICDEIESVVTAWRLPSSWGWGWGSVTMHEPQTTHPHGVQHHPNWSTGLNRKQRSTKWFQEGDSTVCDTSLNFSIVGAPRYARETGKHTFGRASMADPRTSLDMSIISSRLSRKARPRVTRQRFHRVGRLAPGGSHEGEGGT